jgi:hypothetical protein
MTTTFQHVLNQFLDTRPKQKPKPPRSALPALEALEDRVVPTVAFAPHFTGVTQYAPSGSSISQEFTQSLSNTPVVLIFAGSYWTTTQGTADRSTLTVDVQKILNSPYLSALTQYGSDGNAHFDSSLQDNATPHLAGNTPGADDLTSYIRNTLSKNGLSVSNRTLYMIINDPNSSAAGNSIFGDNWTDNQTMHVAYVGPKFFSGTTILSVDTFTQVFSHELAEAMVPTIHVSDPGNLGLGYQVADGEPEYFGSGYGYRLNGVRVQAYWSQKDNAFVVPDGNRQTFLLSWAHSTFDESYTLFAGGDQLGVAYDDSIDVTRTPHTSAPSTGTRVTMNGESVDFDSGVIQNIDVYTGSGLNQVHVNALDSWQTLNVSSYGGSDQVLIGESGSLSDIRGTINVSNSSGHTDLKIDDSRGAQPDSILLTNGAVNVGTSLTVNYIPPNMFGGVADLEIDDPLNQPNVIYAQSLSNIPVSVFGNSSDLLLGPAAGQVLFHQRD